jgi:hypothetical protein
MLGVVTIFSFRARNITVPARHCEQSIPEVTFLLLDRLAMTQSTGSGTNHPQDTE